MATLIANANANFTGAATFAATETGTSALAMIRNNTTTLAAASSVTSPTFTVTNTKVIDAVLLWVKVTSASPTGTFKVDLQKGGVSQASVTVDKADLPQSTANIPYPVLFKLTSTATGDGGSNWTVVLTTTGTQTVTYYRNAAVTGDFTRALRTTTAATAAAGDNLFILGELTGSGTHTSRAVTMDSTAATVYGNGSVNSTTVYGGLIAVGNWGTLSYGTSASTNYILQIAGDLYITATGAASSAVLNIGSSGAEIPRTSTAALKFQPVSADSDFGLYNYDGTLNTAGLSRTSGKNIVKAKLNSNFTSASVITSTTVFGGSNNTVTGPHATGSVIATQFTENSSNSVHSSTAYGGNAANSTQVATVWLARATGTHNRYVRLLMGNNITASSVTAGFYSDIDLQAGTAGTVTAVGVGVATSVSITAHGGGYVIRMVGKVSTSAGTSYLHMMACSAAGTTSYLGDGTSCFYFWNYAIITASSLSDTTFSVDTDTGWLNGDMIAVAGTESTGGSRADHDPFLLNADAGASSMTTPLYPSVTHSGTSPTQAEVALLTRNVKIQSTSNSLMAFIFNTGIAVLNMTWTEIVNCGTTVVLKTALYIAGTTSGGGAKSVTYCSIHDGDGYGIYLASAGSSAPTLATISYNTLFNQNSHNIQVNTSSTGDYVLDNNLIIRAGGIGILMQDGMVGTLTNNTVAGAGTTSPGIQLDATSNGNYTLGTVQNNTAHSCVYGLEFQVLTIVTPGTIEGLTLYHCAYGLHIGSYTTTEVLFNNMTIFGCTTAGVYCSSAVLNIDNSIISGTTSINSGDSIYTQSSQSLMLNFNNVDMNPGTGIYTAGAAGTYFLNMVVSINILEIIGRINNCRFGAPTLFGTIGSANRNAMSTTSYVSIQRYDLTAGEHRTEMRYGTIKTDTTIYHTASPSMRVTPSSASVKMATAPKGRGALIPVNSGSTATVSVYVRKSQVGDGAAYNGNQPRLIQRANPALGQNSDVVLATMSAAVGNWELLTGTTSSATDDGCFEIVVDCDGTAGWINVDEFT